MKDKYLKIYQQRIEEIKKLDISPEEKRNLASIAKNEIFEEYKNNHKNLKEEEQKLSETKTDEIGNIIEKLEEREERGEIGINLKKEDNIEADGFLNPEELFSTLELDSLVFEDDTSDDLLSENDEFLDSEKLFEGIFDEFETELSIQENIKTDSSTKNGVTEVDVDEMEVVFEEEIPETQNENTSIEEFDEVEQIEKEKKRARKMSIIEIELIILLIILVLIVVYLIIGV